jgi:hypothetical protein
MQTEPQDDQRAPPAQPPTHASSDAASDAKVFVYLQIALNFLARFTTCYTTDPNSYLLSFVADINTAFVVATVIACCYVQKASGNMSQGTAEKVFLFGKVLAVAAAATLLYFLSGDFSSCIQRIPEELAKPGATVVCGDGTTSVLPLDIEAGDAITCDCTEDCGCGWFDWLTGCALNQLICVYNCGVAGVWLHFGYRQKSKLENEAAAAVPAAANMPPLSNLAGEPPTTTVGNPTYGVVPKPSASGQLAQTNSFNVDDFDLSKQP